MDRSALKQVLKRLSEDGNAIDSIYIRDGMFGGEECYKSICDADDILGLLNENSRLASGSNYIADDDTFPTEIVFTNGRKVGIAFDGAKPYLTVDMMEAMNER
jgi:hypothetical protein